MGLFLFSCSKEETGQEGDAAQARISICLPAEFEAMQVETTLPAAHQLRCILEIWSQGEVPQLLQHLETVANKTSQLDNFSFDFPLAVGNYNLLVWADYIDADATFTQKRPNDAPVGSSFIYYADKYYDTSSLNAVTVKEMNDLVNNRAADAFFYNCEIKKVANQLFQAEIVMKRPFTQICVREKDLKEFALLQALKVNYKAPVGFNVSTATALAEEDEVYYENTNFDPAASPNGTLFTGNVFSNGVEEMLGEVTLHFTTRMETDNQYQVVIPRIIPLLCGKQVEVSAHMMMGTPDPAPDFEITFDINIADWNETEQEINVTPPENVPEIGDFFFKDGTWNKSLTEDTKADCIGIVFAKGDKPGDDIAYYEGGKEILGYVMALKTVDDDGIINVKDKGRGMSESRLNFYNTKNTSVSEFPITAAHNQTDYNGYKLRMDYLSSDLYKNSLTSEDEMVQWNYPALVYLEENADMPVVPKNASKWYIPSYAQLVDMTAGCFGGKDIVKNEMLRSAYDTVIKEGVGGSFVLKTADRPILSSTIVTGKKVSAVRVYPDNKETPVTLAQSAAAGNLRPVLTIISPIKK